MFMYNRAKMYFSVLLSICAIVSVNGSRIAGGDPVEISKYPFSAALLTNGGQGTTYSHRCGGTILTNRAILSAASCFYTNNNADPASWWRARVGSSFNNAGGTVYFVSQITAHTLYSTTTQANDIAILRTSLAMTLSPGSVEVARISGAAYVFTTNQVVKAIGWGAVSNSDDSSSRELREVEVYVIDSTTCLNRWSGNGFTISNENVCTGWLDVGVVGQCEGDVGSPLLDPTGSFVVGVFSKTEGCANSWLPDLNVKLQPYITWILETVYN